MSKKPKKPIPEAETVKDEFELTAGDIDKIIADKTHWVVKTEAVEWKYMMIKLMEGLGELGDLEAFAGLLDGMTTFFVQKDKISKEDFCKALGIDPERDIENWPVIVMYAIADYEPAATVDYWGEA